MAITKSAQKAIRQNERKKSLNRMYEKKIKNLTKEVQLLIAEKKTEEAKKIIPQVYKILDKAAKSNAIKKNTASRRKSRLAKLAR
ncbi:MAG: 30S ribosomal protein S20 [bacterium]|nr:30S ribosomal protein S20 [bacterium]